MKIFCALVIFADAHLFLKSVKFKIIKPKKPSTILVLTIASCEERQLIHPSRNTSEKNWSYPKKPTQLRDQQRPPVRLHWDSLLAIIKKLDDLETRWDHDMSHEKNPGSLTFHWILVGLIGISIMGYNKPCNKGQYNPLYNLTNQVVVHCSNDFTPMNDPSEKALVKFPKWVKNAPRDCVHRELIAWFPQTQPRWPELRSLRLQKNVAGLRVPQRVHGHQGRAHPVVCRSPHFVHVPQH